MKILLVAPLVSILAVGALSSAAAAQRTSDTAGVGPRQLRAESLEGPPVSGVLMFAIRVPDSAAAVMVATLLERGQACARPTSAVKPSDAPLSLRDDSNPRPTVKPGNGVGVGLIGSGALLFAMAALAGPRDTRKRSGVDLSIGVKANTIIYAGSLVVLDGLVAAPGRTAINLVALGRARETVDNTGGADGDVVVPIEQGVFLYANLAAAITKAHIGRKCYITDDQTVSLTDLAGTKSAAGTIIDIDANGGVWVDIDPSDQLIPPNTLSASAMASVASGDTIGGVPEVFIQNIADASADTDIVVAHKIRVVRFEFHSSGLAAHGTLDTVQLKNGANAITDAVAKTATVNKKVEASTYDPAYQDIAAAGTLRVTAAKNTNVAGVAIITAVRVA